jgi:hypothetical protein
MGAHMTAEDHNQIWDLVEAGESYVSIGTIIGRRLCQQAPRPATAPTEATLRQAPVGRRARGDLTRPRARRLVPCDRSPHRTCAVDGVPRGQRQRRRQDYRAVTAEEAVGTRAKRPKVSKLAGNLVLRDVVEARLAEFWSPEQIAGWLRVEYSDDESMRVSHETIYLALYANQLVARPKQCLRTRRPLRRRRHRRKNQGQGRIRNPIMLSERPAHVEERIEFGHWEGDLIIGNRSTALATLDE